MKKQILNLMDTNELSDHLQVSRRYIYKLVRQRKIPCYKPFGKKMYFDAEEVMQIISRSKRKPIQDFESFEM